jgi:hypothetical protein
MARQGAPEKHQLLQWLLLPLLCPLLHFFIFFLIERCALAKAAKYSYQQILPSSTS